MYHDAYTLQKVEADHLSSFNFAAGMVPFLLNLIQDVRLHRYFNSFIIERAAMCYRGLGSRNSVCVYLSFRLSVTGVLCDKTKKFTADILIPHETAITLVF